MHSVKRVTLVPPKQKGSGGGDNGSDANTSFPFENSLTNGQRVAIKPNSGTISVPVVKAANEINKTVAKPVDRIKHKIFDKLRRTFAIALKLAVVKGYDENFRIRSKSGTYLTDTDLLQLLTHAMSPGRVLHGEEEFIALLADSNVDPELLMNENVKSKLINYNNGIKSNEEKGVTKKSSKESGRSNIFVPTR